MSNPLKIMIFVLVCVLGTMFFGGKKDDAAIAANEDHNSGGAVQIGQPSVSSHVPVAGDGLTDNEQLATLVGKLKGQEQTIQKQQEELQKVQNQLSNSAAQSIDTTQITNDVVSQLKGMKLTQGVEQELAKIKNQLSDLTGGEKVDGLNYSDFGIKDKSPIGVANNNSNSPNLVKPIGAQPVSQKTERAERLYQPQNLVDSWYVGADVIVDEKSGTISPALSKAQVQKMNFGIESPSVSSSGGEGEEEQVVPYATIPQESTLTDAVTMSALLGRIPVGGAVTDPYEFKVLVGATNLAANGLYIPNIDRIVMRGVAKGDYTGQCASGDIVSATFVFQDGRIQTINASDVDGGKDDYESAGTVTKTRLGWISTRGGVPCLSGEYISDAPKFIALQGGLAAMGAAGEAYAEASQMNLGVGDDAQSYVTNAGKFAGGNAVSEMVGTTTDWISEIKESAFGLVYLPTNQNVDIHITKELRIDYDRQGRKIFYGQNNGNRYVKKRLD